MFFKKIVVVIICLLLVSCSSESDIIKLSTGSTGGTYYPIGSAMAEILSDNMKDYTVNAYTGNASVSNCNLILENAVDMALVQSNVAFWAYKGRGMFKEEPIDSIRGVVSLYSEAVQIIVRTDSNIKSVADLKDKRVNIGAKESGNYFDAVAILKVYGIAEEDIDASYLSFNGALENIRNDEIDAVFITSGVPTTSVILMASQVDIDLISIGQEEMNILMNEQPYYTMETIPARTYPGIDYDVATLAVRALWICDEELSEEVVYNMTKVFWNNSTNLIDVHEKGNVILLELALEGMSIPLHPGAVRFYEEEGFDVQE